MVAGVPDLALFSDNDSLRARAVFAGCRMNVFLVVSGSFFRESSFAILKRCPVVAVPIRFASFDPIERRLQVDCPLEDDFAIKVPNRLILDLV